LGFCHLRDGGILRGPDAVVGDQDFQAAKGANCCGYKGMAVGWSAEFLLDGDALFGPPHSAGERLRLARSPVSS
jgi:hypothetical protein